MPPRGPCLLMLAIALFVPAPGSADAVVPVERVRSRVVLRVGPDRASADVGSLRPGDRAEHLGGVSGWRRVRLADGTAGFVSEKWTRVVPEPEGEPEAAPPPLASAQPRRDGFALGRWLRGLGRSDEPTIEVVIRDPRSAVYRNTDPDLPVAGFARLADQDRNHDIVLVLDVSTSTNEQSGVDVDGDGVVTDDWKGPDSVYAAQLAAARGFLRAVSALPRNPGGERVRVGLVSYAGDERRHLDPADRDFPLEAEALHALAERDARVEVPLTSDYPALERRLESLAGRTPRGMTDVAAGLGRALIELEGHSGRGARSRPREAAKVVLLLTDGKPRLPHDREVADRVAAWSGKLASAAGVRVNVFALGENPVTRSRNHAVRRMARRTGGSYVALEKPGRIVEALESTPLSSVERVRIANRTTGRSTRSLATAIDGSFYGEIPLRLGPNEIEVTAVTSDGREATRVFQVDYQQGAPARELVEQLKRIRLENEELIAEIRRDLAREIREKRQEQRRSLELRAGEEPGPLPARRE